MREVQQMLPRIDEATNKAVDLFKAQELSYEEVQIVLALLKEISKHEMTFGHDQAKFDVYCSRNQGGIVFGYVGRDFQLINSCLISSSKTP